MMMSAIPAVVTTIMTVVPIAVVVADMALVAPAVMRRPRIVVVTHVAGLTVVIVTPVITVLVLRRAVMMTIVVAIVAVVSSAIIVVIGGDVGTGTRAQNRTDHGGLRTTKAVANHRANHATEHTAQCRISAIIRERWRAHTCQHSTRQKQN